MVFVLPSMVRVVRTASRMLCEPKDVVYNCEFSKICIMQYRDWAELLGCSWIEDIKILTQPQWFDSLSQADAGYWDTIREAFMQRYESNGRGHIVGFLLARKQPQGESVDDFCTDLRHLEHRLQKGDDDIMDLFVNGLQPDIKTRVLLAQHRNLPHALDIARNVQGALPAKHNPRH